MKVNGSVRLERSKPQLEEEEVAQLCSCCDLPAAYYFAVSYRGQVLRGAICEEHGNAVARERLGIHDPRVSLGSTKIGRALTDPSTKPQFRRIREWEHQGIVGDARGFTSERSSENGFSAHRRRSMSPWRHSRLRGSGGPPYGADVELAVIPATVQQAPAALEPDHVHVPDSLLITDDHRGDVVELPQTTVDDPIRVKIVDAIKVLDKYAIPLEVGEMKADQLLKEHGESIVRSTLRAAIKERRQIDTERRQIA
jgi:hypothetical protein